MAEKEKVAQLPPIPIERIAFGVRFQPHYELMDKMGSVIDSVLRSKGTPFGPDVFPLSSRDVREHSIFNSENDNALRLTEGDAILDILVDTRNTSEIKALAEYFSFFVLESLRKIAHVDDIIRYGVLFQLKECHAVLSQTPVNHFMQQDYPDARSLSLRFTRRLAKEEALVRKNVDDYRNVIYTVKQREEGDVTIRIDYQEYFKPDLKAKEWSKYPFPDFVERGLNYFSTEFQRWLRKMIGKEEAA